MTKKEMKATIEESINWEMKYVTRLSDKRKLTDNKDEREKLTGLINFTLDSIITKIEMATELGLFTKDDREKWLKEFYEF